MSTTDKQRLADKKYREKHRDLIRARKKQYRLDNLEHCRALDRASWQRNKVNAQKVSKIWREKNKVKILLKRVYLREHAIIHYSQGKKECECCKEKEIKFLAIDHINGGGTKHRKEIKGGNIYQWLKTNKYPKGFRVLCHNCNLAIAFYKTCPHQK